jgi:hypothetical protein
VIAIWLAGGQGWATEIRMNDETSKQQPPASELLGATSAPFKLGKGVTTITFQIQGFGDPALLGSFGKAKRVLLKIENMRSTIMAPPFDVYLTPFKVFLARLLEGCPGRVPGCWRRGVCQSRS